MTSKIATSFKIVLLLVIILGESTIRAARTDDNGCQLIIDIYQNANEIFSANCNKLNETHYKCKSLSDLKDIPMIDNTCVRLQDNQYLNTVVSFDNIIGLRIYSYPFKETFRLTCNNQSGFSFTNSSKIQITDIEIFNCGHLNPSSVKIPQTGEVVTISTALYFDFVIDVSILNVTLSDSHGYAFAMYNTHGGINFDRIRIQNGLTVPFRSRKNQKMLGYSSGGAIYIEYNKLNDSLTPTNIFVTTSCFYSNTADLVSPTPQAEGVAEGHIGFGRGGAFSIFFLGNSKNVTTYMNKVKFYHNRAAWGGAVYARFRNSSSGNTIRIVDTDFGNNYGRLSGGGLFVTDTQIDAYNNTIYLTGCKFTKNQAKVGGGMALKYISRKSIDKQQYSRISNSVFHRNTARIGFAIHIEKAPLTFSNIKLSLNSATVASGQGAIYTFDSVLYFIGLSNYLLNNRPTAIVSDCSTFHLHGGIEFTKNVGENGGAISMYGASRLFLYNSSNLSFTNNSAWRRGGAIYVQYSGPSIDHFVVHALNFEQCFIQFAGMSLKDSVSYLFSGRVLFQDNHANINGDGIFLTSLTSCTTTASINDTLSKWKGFTFLPSDKEHIVTRAVNITIDPVEWEQSPGELFTPQVILRDQRGNHVSEQINVDIWNNPKPECIVTIESGSRFIVTENDNISLTLLGNNQPQYNCSYHLTVSLAWNNFTSVSLYNLALKPCYFGYSFNPSIMQCRCMMQKNRVKGIAYCYDGKIFFFNNRWAYPRQKAYRTDNEITVVCPPGYCKNCFESICHYDKHGKKVCNKEAICEYDNENPIQCAPHRNQGSNLCGSCEEGYSVALGSEKCVRCDGYEQYNFIWLIIFLIVLFIFIDLVIIWLDIDIYSNYLNGLLYYCQTVVLLPPSSFDFLQPVKFIIGLLIMESSGGLVSICFAKGFNDLHKQLLNYMFPTIMIVSLYAFGQIARRPNTSFGRYFSRRNCIGAFTIISVIAYTDITRITFNLLNVSQFDPASSKKWLWIHGDTEYFSTTHLPYAIIAISYLVFIVFGFPLVLVFSNRIVAVRLGYNPFTQLTPVFGHFTYCFRKNNFHFSAFYYFARLIMLGVNTFIPIGPLSSILKILICYFVCILFAYSRPYKYPLMNLFDISILVNLTVISMLSLMVRSMSYGKQEKVFVFMHLLIFIPFICVITRLVWVYGIKLKAYLSRKFPKKDSVSRQSPDIFYPQRTMLLPDDRQSNDNYHDNGDHSDNERSLIETDNAETDSYHPYQNMVD